MFASHCFAFHQNVVQRDLRTMIQNAATPYDMHSLLITNHIQYIITNGMATYTNKQYCKIETTKM